MEKYFMIDIETTGILPQKEELLQIGILELDYVDGFWRAGRSFEALQHTDRQPESEFAKLHMTELYKRCNEVPFIRPDKMRERMLSFFRECGANSPDVFMLGWNASNFDLPFLFHHKYLIESHYETINGKDVRAGDVHYRVYEMGGALALARNVLNFESSHDLATAAFEAYPQIEMPDGKEHDAIFDCYRQARTLNGLIKLVRKAG